MHELTSVTLRAIFEYQVSSSRSWFKLHIYLLMCEMSQCKQKSMAVNLFVLVEKTQYNFVTIWRSGRLV